MVYFTILKRNKQANNIRTISTNNQNKKNYEKKIMPRKHDNDNNNKNINNRQQLQRTKKEINKQTIKQSF